MRFGPVLKRMTSQGPSGRCGVQTARTWWVFSIAWRW